MYSINSSQETFMTEYGVPEGVTTTNIPYDGTPFSAYTVLTRGGDGTATSQQEGKTLRVQFGVGGYYADTAAKYIKDFFSDTEVPDTTHQRSKGPTPSTHTQTGDSTMARPIPVVVTRLKTNGHTYHQFQYQYRDYGVVYLLLQGNMEDSLVNLFTYAEVSMIVSLAYHNNAHDVGCEHVSKLWKGRALALELHNRGYLLVKEDMKEDMTPSIGMCVMETGDWLAGNTFVALSYHPFIVDGVLVPVL